MRVRAGSWVLIASLLPGCASQLEGGAPPVTQERLYRLSDWKLEGRLAVQSPGEAWSANLHWEHGRGQERLLISGPFSQGAVSIILQDDLIYINEGNGVVSSSRDADALLQAKLGFSVPLHSLRYWVLGLPEPNADFVAQREPSEGKKGFSQSGWALAYERFIRVHDWVLPGKITALGGGLKLKLIADEWLIKN
ncbi:MAG: lipoprotein insertase outer membrane protein LolB [Methylococcaceae bacterium]|nr:lipoprotein insertase outer membrane protein LolB [Methylococcaceae bacterium]